MCLITLSYRQHPDFPFILVANRDEFYARPTGDMQFWQDNSGILAGQDLEHQGSWLGLNTRGCFSAVTNYRKLNKHHTDQSNNKFLRSRGDLVRSALQSNNTSSAFLEQLETTKHQYGLYNLLNADRTGVYFSSNHGDKCRALRPGLYGLCNASLDTPWPKLRSAKQQLEALLTTDKIDIDQLKALASDRSVVEDKLLPNTGISMAWEKSLSAEFIALESYGTRAKTIILQHHDGHTLVCEQRYNQYGFVSESVFALDLTVFGSARDKFT